MELKTQRLSIRPLKRSDWVDIKQVFLDFSASEYAAYDRALPSEDRAVKALVGQFADTGLFFSVHALPNGAEGDALLGYVCFRRSSDTYDLGYCFHSSHQGRGYAYESARALMDYLMETRPVDGFTAGTALANRPSCRLLEKLGFVCVSTETICFDGSFSFEGGLFEWRGYPE